MTSKTLLTLSAAALLAFSLTACSAAETPAASTSPSASTEATAEADGGSCDGVTVVIDAGDLADASDLNATTCVETGDSILGSDAIAEAGFTIVGTTTYPDDIVCRVNDVPSEDTDLPGADGTTYHETCADMPPATAYWSLWVKPAEGEWDYAQSSLPTLELAPGDSVQLLFTLNGAPAAPTS